MNKCCFPPALLEGGFGGGCGIKRKEEGGRRRRGGIAVGGISTSAGELDDLPVNPSVTG